MIWSLFLPRMKRNSDRFGRRPQWMLPRPPLVPSASPLLLIRPLACLVCRLPPLTRSFRLLRSLLLLRPPSQRRPSLVPPPLSSNPLLRSPVNSARRTRSICTYSPSPHSKARGALPRHCLARRPKRTALPCLRRPPPPQTGSMRTPRHSGPIQRQLLSLL